LGWADTIAFAISAGSLVVNAYRNDIAKTALGRLFLEAWDAAEGIAEYYNWGRLGVDGLRLVHAKVSPAFERWRQEAPSGLSSAERDGIAIAKQQTKEWLEAVKKAESAEARKYLEAHPPKEVKGEPGHRHADIEGGHEVKEVSGGLGCEFHSPTGTDVLCPVEFEHAKPLKTEEPAQPGAEASEAAREAEKAKLIADAKEKVAGNNAKMGELQEKIDKARETVKKATAKASGATGKELDDLLDQVERNKKSIQRWKNEQEALRWSNNALRDEASILEIPETAGGPYKQIKKKTSDGLSEAHHMPAWDSYEDVIVLSHGDGPSIWMHEQDHNLTTSRGNGPDAIAYRQKQSDLIAQGKFMEAFEMDVQDLVKNGLYEKYERAILQARRYAKDISSGKLQLKPGSKPPSRPTGGP
jgi:hypothetical protein